MATVRWMSIMSSHVGGGGGGRQCKPRRKPEHQAKIPREATI